jgi:hypothetical protein
VYIHRGLKFAIDAITRPETNLWREAPFITRIIPNHTPNGTACSQHIQYGQHNRTKKANACGDEIED